MRKRIMQLKVEKEITFSRKEKGNSFQGFSRNKKKRLGFIPSRFNLEQIFQKKTPF